MNKALFALAFFCLSALFSAAALAQGIDGINGAWATDLEATAKVYKLPQDLAKDLDGLVVTFDVKKNKLLAAWPDGSKESRDYKVTARKKGSADLRISDKYDVTVDFSQKDLLVLTENGNSLVLKRVPAVKK